MTGWVKIMNVSRFIKDDIKRSLIHNRYRIILCVFIVFGLMAAFYKHIGVINSVRDNKIQPSVCDYILYMTRGICRVTEENITRLEIPYVWISLCIMCGLMVLDYMYSDMRGMGKNVLVYSKKKSLWWISKCITSVAAVTLVYVIIWLMSVMFIFVSKGSMEGIHTDMFITMYNINTSLLPSNMLEYSQTAICFYIVLYPWIISVCIDLFQVGLSIYTGPVVSFVIIIILDVLAVFSNNILLCGNWIMAERCSILAEDGLNIYVMLAMAAVLAIVSVIVGWHRFKKKDIL